MRRSKLFSAFRPLAFGIDFTIRHSSTHLLISWLCIAALGSSRQHSASVEQKDLKHHKDNKKGSKNLMLHKKSYSCRSHSVLMTCSSSNSTNCVSLNLLTCASFEEILEQLDAFARRVDEQPAPKNFSTVWSHVCKPPHASRNVAVIPGVSLSGLMRQIVAWIN